MGENEYIQLQDLLTKYRVNCIKEFGEFNNDSGYRQKMLRQIRCIDTIRRDMFLICDKEGE